MDFQKYKKYIGTYVVNLRKIALTSHKLLVLYLRITSFSTLDLTSLFQNHELYYCCYSKRKRIAHAKVNEGLRYAIRIMASLCQKPKAKKKIASS